MAEGAIDARVAALHADHRCAHLLGIELLEAGGGRAVVAMRLEPRMLNFFGTGNGGIIFTLADTAAAYACQSRGGRTVAQSANITFTAPAQEGSLLSATAIEQNRSGRTGIYDVTVRDEEGVAIALARYTSLWTSKPPAPER